MKQRRLIDWPYVIGLVLLPVAIAAILHLVALVQRITRYESIYFSPTYLERYGTPGSVAIDLERALKQGDTALMAELLGTRRGPGPLEARPRLIFALMLGTEGKYYQYLYFNAENYNRVIQYVTEHDGRYIATEPDLFFYVDSGRWLGVASPIALTWWILVIVYTVGTYVYRRMAVAREKRYG